MIFTERQITVRNGKSSINEPVILYRGDFEVSIRFTIMESKFRFKSGVNLVDTEKASYGQLAILAPYGGNVFSDVVKCEDGTVTFTLTKEMIDQLEEVGLYSFQIRLFDYYRESRVSIPPVEFGIEVREPVASEDHDNSVNNAIVGYSIAKVVDPKEENIGNTFDDNGQYNKTDWETGDRITEGKLNKIEDALDKINQNEINDKNFLNKQMTSNFNVLQNQIDNMVIESGNADAEVEQARGEYNLLNQRLNAMDETDAELVSQLAHNTNNINDLSLQTANSKGYLELPVYNSDSNQATHPSVLFFAEKWNGYYYWMAMTPYEKEDENLENPSILASNDGIIWEVPEGLINPIDKTLNVKDYHLSDTHLVYANGQLECWYRKRTRGVLPTNEIILRKKTTDGVNWGDAEVLYETNVQRADLLLSPTVIFEYGKYKIWVSNFRDGVIDYFESNTGSNWVKIRSIKKPKHPKNYKVWHMDIKHTSNGYEMYYCAGLDYKCYEICYSKSDDNINYSDAVTVITPSTVGFDESRVYRPCFVDSWLNKRYIYYGAINTSNDWHIGLSISSVEKPTLLDGAILSNNTEYFGGNNFNIPNKLQVFKDISVGKYAYIKENVIKLVKPGVGGVNLKVSETKTNTLQVLSDSGSGLGHIEVNAIMVTDIIGDTVLVKSTNSDTNAKLKIVKPNVGGTTIKQVIDGLLEFRTDSDNDYTDIMIKRLLLKDTSNDNTYRVQCENGLFKYYDGNYLQTVSLVYHGDSKERPNNATIGTQYFDEELGKPIWYKGNNIWVDSNGTTV